MQEKQQLRQEQIGKVTLDYTWYPGEDLYSDGDVEEKLLEIAETVREEDLNAEIARRRDWSVLYHMSDVRENIVAAMPITKADSVLEVGAGCGAVTGQLARMAADVTCVDLSRRRSLINAHRHRDYENIRILLGNFQDVEKHLTKQYDVITLIGVFEYAQAYIGTDAPYTEFLRQIHRHLAPGGRIVIAIENRLGLKYWAGCREDHTGNFFEGLENYSAGSYVRTFSRPELEKIFAQTGFPHPVFYYPYPDYKLPSVIFSDDCLPQPGSLHRELYHFDRDRMTLFNENAVCDSLIAGGQYPLFANSYLVLLEDESSRKDGAADEPPQRRPFGTGFRSIYTKYSMERDPRFAIRTDIEADAQGGRRVVKRAVSPAAQAHVRAIAENGKKLEELYAGTKIHVNRIQNTADLPEAAVLEYIDGEPSLESRLTQLLASEKPEEAFETVRELERIIRAGADTEFTVTDGFEELFGSGAARVLAGSGRKSARVTDLDMVPENFLIRRDGGWDLIDFEWSYDMPIPVDFVVYRTWHYFLARCLPEQAEEPLLEKEGFSGEDILLFEEMERSWQARVKGSRISLDDLHAVIAPPAVDVRSELMLHETQRGGSFAGSLYYSENGEFTEEHRKGCVLQLAADGRFTAEISLDSVPLDGQLRWDPLERKMCRIHIEKTNCPGAVFVPINGSRKHEEGQQTYDEFLTVDPAYRIEGDLSGVTRLRLEGTLEIIYLENRMQQFEQLRLERDTYYAEMERLRAQIESIHQTKPYRLLKAFRRLTGRK